MSRHGADCLALLAFVGATGGGGSMTDIEQRVDALHRQLGANLVDTAPALLDDWSRCTLPWDARPAGVVRPVNAQACVEALGLLAAHDIPVHPVSRGRAWGLGSRLPVRDAVMLDLSGLDRIHDLDPIAGTVRIEPGVTFRQLQAALDEAGADFEVPVFGGPPDASVLANALERGDGMGRFGDRFASLWDLDVALTTGERLRTGWGRLGADDLSRCHGRAPGPLLEGLFSQSGFGCVLSGRIGLAPRLPNKRHVVIEVGPADRLPPVVETLRSLVATGVVCAHDFYIWDGAKRLSSQVVAADLDDGQALPFAIDDWAVSLMLAAAHDTLLAAKVAIVEQAIGALSLEHAWDAADRDGPATYRSGGSDGSNLTSCYWTKPALPDGPLDPNRDGCGFLWLCLALPFTGEAMRGLDEAVRDVRTRFDVFVASGCEAVSHGALQCYLSLAWDRDQPGADARAMAAHDALHAACAARGWLPYRHTLASLDVHPEAEGDWAAVAARLRQALDPKGLLSAGRVPEIS